MARGESGRIVIEVEPDFKRKLYSALDGDNNLALKDWFVAAAANYIAEREQPSLPELNRKKRTKANAP